ncbi:hypothetical protein ACXR2U_06640 [Jatrophihabitans sp. YIM 134969]
MVATDLVTTWVGLSAVERTVVRSVYVHDRSIAETARQLELSRAEVGRALHTAYRSVAAALLAPEPGDAPPAVPPVAAVATTLRRVARVEVASWRWDTSDQSMQWSGGMYDLYGYPRGSVAPTIGRHQSHKYVDDRVSVERLVLTAATEHGPVVFPQRIIRTDGAMRPVVMHVVREPGPAEVLVGRVLADQVAA